MLLRMSFKTLNEVDSYVDMDFVLVTQRCTCLCAHHHVGKTVSAHTSDGIDLCVKMADTRPAVVEMLSSFLYHMQVILATKVCGPFMHAHVVANRCVVFVSRQDIQTTGHRFSVWSVVLFHL